MLYITYHHLRAAGLLLWPVIPDTCERLLRHIGCEDELPPSQTTPPADDIASRLPIGARLAKAGGDVYSGRPINPEKVKRFMLLDKAALTAAAAT